MIIVITDCDFVFRDKTNGGSCHFDDVTGMPDSNCIFIISTTQNDDVRSSYMAVPFLPNVTYQTTIPEIMYIITKI